VTVDPADDYLILVPLDKWSGLNTSLHQGGKVRNLRVFRRNVVTVDRFRQP